MRLIDADAFRAQIQQDCAIFADSTYLSDKARRDELINVIARIIDAPTVDAVQVVRCGECKHRKEKTFWCEKVQDFISNPEWFCADGKRKGGDK